MRLLVLGGIRSGKSEVAEALVAGADGVRYVATAPDGDGDAAWTARIAAALAGRTFADANGLLNQRVAAACDGVALVIAGEVTWLRGGGLIDYTVAREQAAAVVPPVAPVVDREPFVFEAAGAGSVLTAAD